jgi:hypothetical protein
MAAISPLSAFSSSIHKATMVEEWAQPIEFKDFRNGQEFIAEEMSGHSIHGHIAIVQGCRIFLKYRHGMKEIGGDHYWTGGGVYYEGMINGIYRLRLRAQRYVGSYDHPGLDTYHSVERIERDRFAEKLKQEAKETPKDKKPKVDINVLSKNSFIKVNQNN